MKNGGKLIRSVPRIHDLEIVNDDLGETDKIVTNVGPSNRSDSNVGPSNRSNVSDNAEKPYVTRHGRVVKHVKKLSM